VQFNSLEYALLLGVAFVAYWATARRPVLPTVLLLVANYVFYGSWNRWYLLLIFASSTVDYFVGRAIARAPERSRKKAILWLSLAYHLSILGLFKYYDFFVTSTNAAGAQLGLSPDLPLLHLILPAGISFFTFQSMSYAIDVYRGEIEPEDSYLRYLAFVSFFPQLVAGPIVRARDLLPGLRERPPLVAAEASHGLFLILVGLTKKIAFADPLALNLVDRVFDLPWQFSSLEVLTGVYGYAFQIYCDFSAYSDIAIGSALLFGFRFPPNFDSPYRAQDLQDFWRRWHISLSTWLRDYLYVPLGGNRGGEVATYRNLMLTMFLGGLWHGASWNFVVWGLLHGGALAVLRYFQRSRAARGLGPLLGERPAARVLAGFITFNFVCLAWIFFRARTWDDAMAVLDRLSELSLSANNLGWVVLATLAGAAATHLCPRAAFDAASRRFTSLPAWAQALVLVAGLQGLGKLAGTEVVPFIYFQF
jgi:D-alanyl-lipoteichoic acid acyltransferase DltB (MBOAT superfamily)